MKHEKFIKIMKVVAGTLLVFSVTFLLFLKKPSVNIFESPPLDLSKTGKPITFMIAGDAMLGRTVAYQFGNDVTQAFENLGQNFFKGYDLSMINLEGPISETEIGYNTDPNNLIFNFPPQSIDALKYLGINAASLANNHSQNQGKSGFETTRKLLSDAGIKPVGSQMSFDENNIAVFSNKGYKMTVIAANFLDIHPDLTETIGQEKEKGNFVLVFPHWGSEYQNNAHSSSQEELARTWIDAGADIVIGSHPHVIQDAEIYKNKPIFYSVGNLIFDQTFSSQTMQGLILKGEISKSSKKIEIIPIRNYHLRVELLEGEKKDTVINQFKDKLGAEKFNGNILEIK